MIVAELSANHGHRLDIALESVRAAAKAGADAIKIQTYTADTITLDCSAPDFIVTGGTLWDGRTLHNLYEEAYTPWEWHEAIFAEARKAGITCFSTPFDKTAVDFLETLGNPIYKIASFEITDIPLISYAASKGKPMVISTGIATLEDIELAVNACLQAGNTDITLLKCTSAYPAPISAANLLTMKDMEQRFGPKFSQKIKTGSSNNILREFPGVKTGLSDHTTGSEVALTAAALGATMVEKHFILDRSIGGPDAAFSMEIPDLARLVTRLRSLDSLTENPLPENPRCPQQNAEGNPENTRSPQQSAEGKPENTRCPQQNAEGNHQNTRSPQQSAEGNHQNTRCPQQNAEGNPENTRSPQQNAEGKQENGVTLSTLLRATEPSELKEYICEEALGTVSYPTDPATIPGRQFCRSLYVAEDMKAGDTITEQNVRSVRPGYGLSPRYLPDILGKQVSHDLPKGTRFSLDLLA